MKLEEILTLAIKKEASDVHLKAGLVPVIRKHGKLRPLQQGMPQLTNQDIEDMAFAIMDQDQRNAYLQNKDLDLGYGLSGVGRFRVNIFRQRGSTRMVIRYIPFQIPSIDELNLPEVIKRIANFERGLILVTGVTGSGKSSTLAAMIDHINSTKNKHILTIEDPIEFLIRDRKSIISQREFGVDTRSFSTALRAALRQDPDVILIGEMRDCETIEIAMVAAETGHLVLSTLHTVDTQESINRILTVFEPHQQNQIRLQLASVLKAVISQRLARRKDKLGFVPAVEVLINNARVREMIEEPSKTKDLRLVIEESKDTVGMQSFDQSLMDLVGHGLVEYDEALRLSSHPEDFQLHYSGVISGNQEWSESNKMKSRLRDEWEQVGNLEFDDRRTTEDRRSTPDRGDDEDE